MSRRSNPILTLCCRFVARRIQLGESNTAEETGSMYLISYLTKTSVEQVTQLVDQYVSAINRGRAQHED